MRPDTLWPQPAQMWREQSMNIWNTWSNICTDIHTVSPEGWGKGHNHSQSGLWEEEIRAPGKVCFFSCVGAFPTHPYITCLLRAGAGKPKRLRPLWKITKGGDWNRRKRKLDLELMRELAQWSGTENKWYVERSAAWVEGYVQKKRVCWSARPLDCPLGVEVKCDAKENIMCKNTNTHEYISILKGQYLSVCVWMGIFTQP